MAYSTRRYVKHIDKYDVTHRLEIQEDGFGGSEDSIGTTGQVFQFEHETHASEDEEILNVYENPVQKGSIELFLRIDNSTDRTLITDIFNGDEDDFRLVWKIDGTVFWTGTILNDMLEYPESDYPYMAKLWAKDFSRLEGMFYTSDGTPNGTLPDTRQTLITTFADLIGELGYGLDIQTHTSWTTQDTTDATDFLQQIYHETFALREYANSGEESDQPIKVLDALEMMCRNFGCVIRQEGNVFKIIQYSEYETPASVNVTVYDSTGTEKTAATSTDLSLDTSTNDITITDRSITRAFKGIKEAEATFSHRSRVGELTLPRNVYITGTGQESYSQSFISTGEQEIKLSGTLRAYHSTQEPSGYADLLVRVGQYYFNGNNWTTTTTDRVRIDITGFPVQREDDDGTYFYYQGFFDISTPKVPSDATTPIEIEFENAVIEAGPDVVADETAYENIDFNIIKPGDDQANSATLVYRLTQSGVYSTNYDIGETLFGDGPAESSRSALRFSSATNDITSTSWQRRGTTSGYRLLHENLLKEIIDLQRGNRIRTDGDTLGEDYDPEKIITYRSKSLAYTGGQFDGKNGDWLPVLFEINIQTASDTFETIIKSTSGGVQGSSSTSSGGGSGGIDQSTADARYFKQASLLSEVSAGDLPTLYGNIGLDDGSADLDLNSLDIGGSTFVDSSRNVSARDVRFNNELRYNGALSGSAQLIFNIDPTDATLNRFGLVERPDESGIYWADYENSEVIIEFKRNANVDIGSDLDVGNTLTINSQLLFNLGNEQLLSTDANVQFNEVDIGGNWKLDSESEGGIERLRIQALGVDDGAELFIQSKGSADLARITLAPDPSPSNYSFVTLESNGSNQIINSSSEGTESTLPLSIRMDGAEALGIDTSRNLTTHANIADDGFSDWFSANPAGYEIAGATGVADFRTVLTDELVAKAFTADVAQALAGSDILTKSVGILAEDFTIPAVSSSGTIVIEDLEGLGDFQAFEANDWLRIRIVDRTSSPAVIGDVWGQVTSYSDNADGTQDWTFAVDYAGTSDVLVGQTVYKGAVVLDYGTSGDTFIERTVLDRSGTSDFTKVPYDRIVRWTNGGSGGPRPSEATYEVLTQIGNINGLGGFSSATYGAYFKDNLVLEIGNGDMTIGKNVGPSDEDGIFIDSDDYWFSDGTGSVGDGILNWDASIPEVNLANFTATNEYLTDGNVYIGNDLINNGGAAGRTLVGNLLDNSAPGVRAYGDITNTYVQVVGRSSSSDNFLQITVDGNDVMSVSGDDALIAGWRFDDTDLWTGSSSKSSATARFGSTEGLIFDVGGGASSTDQRTLKWLDSGSLRGGMFVSAAGRTQIVGYDGSNPVVGVQIDDQVELSLPVKMVDGEVYMLDLPTSDPSSPGQLWNDSGTLKVSTTSPPSAPSAPSNPSLCKNTTLNVLRFEWDSVASADSYDVYRSTDGSNFSFITNTSITRYDDSVPFNDQSQLYYYKVQARNDGGNSGFSSTVNDSWNTATAC